MMAISLKNAHYNTKIVKSGLVMYTDPNNLVKMGSPSIIDLTGNATLTNNNFLETEGVWRSDADEITGSGTSELSISGVSIDTGEFTLMLWFKGTSNPNVGSNNNYRSLFTNSGTSQSPFGVYYEQSRSIQMTLVTTVRTYRYIMGIFTQYTPPLNEWSCLTFSYNKTNGFGSSYRDGILLRSGLMSADTPATINSSPGEELLPLLSSTTMAISNNKAVVDPSGLGCFPGDIGPCMIYNRPLTSGEVLINYNAIKVRYGL